MIHFEDFGCDTIYAIVRNEISAREEEYKDKLTQEEIYAAVSPLVSIVGENARIGYCGGYRFKLYKEGKREYETFERG